MLEPVVRIFNLVTIFNVLLEHTVLVADTVSVSRVFECSKGIKETCCETTETTVAKTCIRFFIFNKVIVDVHSLENFLNLVHDTRVNKVV